MKKTNKRAVGIQVSRKKTAAKRAEEPIDLAKMIPKLGRLSVSESKKVVKAWQKAEVAHIKKDTGKLFNPTLMSEETLLNFMDYLQLTIIDFHTGYVRDFVPTQDYEQELARENRDR
jgi:hypothetical protein